MKKMLVLGMAATLMATATAAFAYPTLFLPATGTITQPNAEVVGPGEFDLALDVVEGTAATDDVFSTRVLYGIAENIEVGFVFDSAFNGDGDWAIAGKWATPVTIAGFNVAVGAGHEDIDDDVAAAAGVDDTTDFLYVVGTRQFTDQVTGSAGLVADFGDSTSAHPFVTATYTLPSGLSVNGELLFNTEDDGFGKNISLRYPLTPSSTAQIGWLDGERMFIGADYVFGK